MCQIPSLSREVWIKCSWFIMVVVDFVWGFSISFAFRSSNKIHTLETIIDQLSMSIFNQIILNYQIKGYINHTAAPYLIKLYKASTLCWSKFCHVIVAAQKFDLYAINNMKKLENVYCCKLSFRIIFPSQEDQGPLEYDMTMNIIIPKILFDSAWCSV